MNIAIRRFLGFVLATALWAVVPFAFVAMPQRAIAQTSNLTNISSIAKLRTLPSGTAVNVQGYYAPNDGGGGVYVWNSTSTATDNGGTIIQPTGGGPNGRWILQSFGPTNVKQFGAKGDGVTDDYAAIQAAVNSIPTGTQGGYSLYFPPGIYECSNTIVIGSRRMAIHGNGVIGSNTTAIVQTNANKDLIDYTTGNLDTFSMFDIQLQGASVSGTGRLLVLGSAGQAVYDSRLSDCWFVGQPTWAVYAVNLQGIHITNCAFDSSGSSNRAGLYVANGSDLVIEHNRFYSQQQGALCIVQGEDNTIDGNLFDFSGTANDTTGAIMLTPTSVGGGNVVRSTTISGNTFRANFNDILLLGNGGVSSSNTGCNDTLISSNSTDRANRRFVYSKDTGNTRIIGNNINSPSQSGTGLFPSIELAGTADSSFIVGNDLTDQTGGAVVCTYGILMNSTTTNTRIGLNSFRGAGSGEISIASGATLMTTQPLSYSPVIYGDSVAGTNTYSLQSGIYWIEGNRCYFTIRIVMSAKDAAMAGNILVSLPVKSANITNMALWPVVTSENVVWGTNEIICGDIINNVNYVKLLAQTSNGAITTLGPTNINSNSAIYITGWYFL